MRSRVPKVLHDLCGRPLVAWPVAAAREAGAGRVVVVGGPDRALEAGLPEDVALAVQPVRRRHGRRRAGRRRALRRRRPRSSSQRRRPAGHRRDAGALLPPTRRRRGGHAGHHALEDPTGYGRIVRGAGGAVERIVETKRPGDATRAAARHPRGQRRRLRLRGRPAARRARAPLHRQRPGRAVPHRRRRLLAGDGREVRAELLDDPSLLLGVNDRVELARVRALAQQRIHEAHMRAGVTIVDPPRPSSTSACACARHGRRALLVPARGTSPARAAGSGP